MIKYNVRSKLLVDLYNEIKSQKLIMSPHFQRKLVWRGIHKSDFIDTILRHFPFPEIFIARGSLDIKTMSSISCVVDGQQRLNAIQEFIEGDVEIDGKFYEDLSDQEKAQFLKYEVAIVDLDISHDAPEIIEIFKRLNRTFYALSAIERQSTEYASSEFMLVAKLLSDELRSGGENDLPEEGRASIDPNITDAFREWSKKQKLSDYKNLLSDTDIFSKYEYSRMVHLSFTLNILATLCEGFYNRNENSSSLLEDYKDEFPKKKEIVQRLNEAAKAFVKLHLDQIPFWMRKANAFTALICLDTILQNDGIKSYTSLATRLKKFATNHSEKYALAAKEAVNNKRERVLRHEELLRAIG